jgi:DNA invertase Pin-like site-specific DNA recombinase
MLLNILATFAQFERRLISQRTKDALAVKRSQGVRLGRPSTMAPEARDLIVSMRKSGDSLWTICKALEARGIKTSQGGAIWRPSSLESVLKDMNAGLPNRLSDARAVVL